MLFLGIAEPHRSEVSVLEGRPRDAVLVLLGRTTTPSQVVEALAGLGNLRTLQIEVPPPVTQLHSKIVVFNPLCIYAGKD